MDHKVSSISFGSNIRLIPKNDFMNNIKFLDKGLHEVAYPWTPDTVKTGKELYTLGVGNCISGLVIDGKQAAMFHQAHWDVENAKAHSQKIFDPKELEQALLSKLDLTCKGLHGLIFGGIKAQEKKEVWLLNMIREIFCRNKIPYTEITSRKETKYYGYYSLHYERDVDTLNITTDSFNTRVSDSKHKEARIENGIVFYNLREKNEKGFGLKECSGTPEDYLKNQFYNVNLSSFDKII